MIQRAWSSWNSIVSLAKNIDCLEIVDIQEDTATAIVT